MGPWHALLWKPPIRRSRHEPALSTELTRSFHRLLLPGSSADLPLLGWSLKRLLRAVDWTHCPHRRRGLVAAVAVARRALLVAVSAPPAHDPFSSQNRIEEAFLERLLNSLQAQKLRAVLI